MRTRIRKGLEYLAQLHSEQSAFVTVGVIPTVLTALGFFILKQTNSEVTVVNATLVALWLTILTLHNGLLAYNTNNSEKIGRDARIKNIPLAQIRNYIENRHNYIAGTKGSLALEVNLVDKNTYIGSSIYSLNAALFEAICRYITNTKNRGANIILCMITPNKNGVFERVDRSAKTSGMPRDISSITHLTFESANTMGIRLWNSDSIVMSVSDTEAAEASGKFVFFTEEERDHLKSMICYKLLDPISSKPLAIWCVESDKKTCFPSQGNSIEFNQLSEIFDSFYRLFKHEYLIADLFYRQGQRRNEG